MLTKKSLKKMYANLIKYQAENCPVLPVRNLIFTCNRRVKGKEAEFLQNRDGLAKEILQEFKKGNRIHN